MKKMNSTISSNGPVKVLDTAFAYFAVFYLDFGKKVKKQEYYKDVIGAPGNMMGGRHFSSNDLNLANERSNGENIHHKSIHTLPGKRLLQACVFNRDKIVVLIQRLACLIQARYYASLLPLSQPSIPIAYRKLII